MNYLNVELNGIDKNGEEKIIKLSDYKGENIILYFYPQDDTPVCTEEANKFNESLEKLKETARIIGVSKNDIDDHKIFKEKYKLNFTLLSDNENKLKNSILQNINQIKDIKRSTFILNKEGKIEKFWEKVDIENHIEEILKYFNL